VLELNEPDADEGGEAGPTVRRIGDFASATEQASRARLGAPSLNVLQPRTSPCSS